MQTRRYSNSGAAGLIKLSRPRVAQSNEHERSVGRYRESRHGALVRHQIDQFAAGHLEDAHLIAARCRHEGQPVVRRHDDVTDR